MSNTTEKLAAIMRDRWSSPEGRAKMEAALRKSYDTRMKKRLLEMASKGGVS